MFSYKTKGIIIRRKNFTEADKLITIYSGDFGKINIVAKGARKILSKLAGYLELFYFDDFLIAHGKSIDTLVGVELIKDYHSLRADKEKINQAYYISELINRFTVDNDPNHDIFILARKTFDYLNQKSINPLLLLYFSVRLISYTGHSPQLNNCAVCDTKLTEEKNYFSLSGGGVVCSNCAKKKIDSFFLDNKLIKILRLFLEKDIDIVDRLEIEQSLKDQLLLLNKKIIEYTLGDKIKSSRFI